MARLSEQLREALQAFHVCTRPPALIGGLALSAHKVVRATRDLDFLAAAADAERLHQVLLALGYVCIYRTEDVANYRRGEEGLDLLFARRPHSERLLSGAQVRDTVLGQLHVVSAEGLIGFKLQALANNPARLQDLEDIRDLLRLGRDSLDMAQVSEYFALFGREQLLHELLDGPAEHE
ncbi:hypothetical protein [Tahibacter harae]|uniref:Nucleotidyltransferase family protein n=1 Tax=Tahibacter harae TaxID=2963937 RepID=A0ABT1QRW5_9GAMM|nr:hypothetical protein [Tahibacter harae]MCQ4164997.1 hypothetical protein [Tahibacter harae]